MKRVVFLALIIVALPATSVPAQLPVSGVPVPELSDFDDLMQQIMSTNNIDSGVLAVSKDGVVVYQRGFGTDLPENTPMRLASVEKPITAAAIRRLIADFQLGWNDKVFNGRGGSTGILQHQPFGGSFGDNRLGDITITHLMNHRGGWDKDKSAIGDPQFKTRQIAEAMGIASPADRDDIIRYMLSQPLQFVPGDGGCPEEGYCYSNFGYMLLGRIVEEVSGMSLRSFVLTRVLTPDMWVPNQEVFSGRSLEEFQSLREPHYQCTSCNDVNVFDPDGPQVPFPYGGFHLEAFKGHGNFVASAVPLLTYMDYYQVAVLSNAGTPLPPMNYGGGAFAGGMDGTSTCMWQRGDGINIAVLFTRRDIDIAPVAAQLVSDTIDNQNYVWPTFPVDGFWIDFTAPNEPIQVGGFNHPFRTMNQGLIVGDGAKLRFQPGSSSWTGTISHKVIMDAPFGAVTIGN